jgi:hypothetical protein
VKPSVSRWSAKRHFDGTEEVEFQVGLPELGVYPSRVVFTNPLEVWMQIVGGSGLAGTLVLIARFVRDFGAERRQGLSQAKLGEAGARTASAAAMVDEARAELLAERLTAQMKLERALRERLLAEIPTVPWSSVSFHAVLEQIIGIEQIAALERLSATMMTVDLVGRDSVSGTEE